MSTTLKVPETASTGKRTRPKSPRKKAPVAPKKKKHSSLETDSKSNNNSHTTTNESSDARLQSKVDKNEETARQKSVSPRKEQYMSLLEEMVGQGDMVLLDPITEDSILQNLEKRYSAGDIYTYIGPVVVSVNPYKPLTIYTPEHVEEYRNRNSYELPPHIYALADSAYRSMRDHNLDQCVIIAGESGAGKTEASKLLMQYVAAVSGQGEEVEYVKQQLLQSNPVLEAFGNAKTHKNDNSSRFGKYMDIQFDFKGDPVGGVVSKYLLEKSRVVGQAPGESNFHIFYQLLAGSSNDVLKMLHLSRATKDYHYLGESNSTSSDRASFDETVEAMSVIGFVPEEISMVLELLSAILNLGNIQFAPVGEMGVASESASCAIKDDQPASYACDMLGCSLQLLTECLTKHSVETRMDFVLKPLTLQEAEFARDALSKALYDRLFSWLVRRINDKIKATSKAKKKVMGVLDIYGFEVFERNGFEQFIINYCNEKLQQIFIELTLKSEQDEYIREGIEWEHIDYFDNAIICELIEHPTTGMLAQLDEECLRPGKATDQTLLQKYNQRCLSHAHYESRAMKQLLSDQSLTQDQFRLRHYAGKVTYDVSGFLETNKDLLFKDLSKAMFACERGLLKELFPEGDPEVGSLKRPQTTGYQFRTSVAELMKNLLSKTPNYIRCIKPNFNKKAGEFDEALVRHQVAYLGLLENVRVRRAGFAYRQEYTLALARYKMLSGKTWPVWKGRPKDGVKEVLKACSISKKDYSYGRSKIFIRHPRTVFELEGRRKTALVGLTILLQKVYRGWHQWRKYQDMRNAQILISCNFRCYKWRNWFLDIRFATVMIQSYYRGMLARRELRVLKYIRDATWAAGIILKFFYGWKARKEVRELRFHRKFSGAALTIQRFYRGWRVRKFFREERAATTIQAYYRGWRVRRYYHVERAAIVIQSYYRGWRDRQYALYLRAVVTIQSYFRGWKARVETKKLFKAVAGPKVARFMWNAVCVRFLLSVLHNLPTNSLHDKRWPDCPNLFRDASEKLRLIHHKWRCKLVRDYYISNPRERRTMSEKARASGLFRGKKSLYPKTVPIPFKADRLNLRSDERWAKLVATTNEQRIVWGDNVQKLNRKDGKGVPMVLVVTGNSFMLLDPKTLSLKYRVELQHIKQISLSCYGDQIFIIHIDPYKSTDKSYVKGDFILRTPNVVEMVTKTHAVIQENLSKKLKVVFNNEIEAKFKVDEVPCVIRFQHDPRAGGHAASPVCRRRGSNIHVVV